MTWKIIPQWPEYEVSDTGQVRRRQGGQGTRAGYVLKPVLVTPRGAGNGRSKTNYCKVSLHARGVRRQVHVHTLVLEAFVGPRPSNDHVANHKDGNGENNNKANLEWATYAENAQHAYTVLNHGAARGEAKSDLTEDDIREMRRRVASGESRASVGRHFGISSVHVGQIVARKSWAHVA